MREEAFGMRVTSPVGSTTIVFPRVFMPEDPPILLHTTSLRSRGFMSTVSQPRLRVRSHEVKSVT
jgi:hypothetical protein